MHPGGSRGGEWKPAVAETPHLIWYPCLLCVLLGLGTVRARLLRSSFCEHGLGARVLWCGGWDSGKEVLISRR